MSNLIERQVAIDALVKAIRKDPYYDGNKPINGLGVCDVLVILNDLPSAQLELCEDAVSRAQVRQLLEKICDSVEDGFGYNHEEAVEYLDDLPSAQPEVIRCKDCKDYQTGWETSYLNRHYCATMDSFMPKDGFCNYAERRIDE